MRRSAMRRGPTPKVRALLAMTAAVATLTLGAAGARADWVDAYGNWHRGPPPGPRQWAPPPPPRYAPGYYPPPPPYYAPPPVAYAPSPYYAPPPSAPPPPYYGYRYGYGGPGVSFGVNIR